MFFDEFFPRIELFENSLADFNPQLILKRFLGYFQMHFIEKIAQYTGEKAVQNGTEMVINAAQIIRFLDLST